MVFTSNIQTACSLHVDCGIEEVDHRQERLPLEVDTMLSKEKRGKSSKGMASRSGVRSSARFSAGMASRSNVDEGLKGLLSYFNYLYMEGEISDSAYQTLTRHVLSLLVEDKVNQEVERIAERFILKVLEKI